MLGKLKTEDEKVLLEIYNFFISHRLEKPYVVGGAVRDLAMGRDYHDLDITNNTGGQSFVGGLFFAIRNKRSYKINRKGYVTITSRKHSNVDFSSGMMSIPSDRDISETESRNFTINSMLYDIKERKIIDEFGGLEDIKNKVIRTISSPDLSLKDKQNRVIKCIELATVLRFSIAEDIVSFYKNNKDYVRYCFINNENYLQMSFSKAILYDEDLFLKNVINLGVFSDIPLSGSYKDLLIKRKLLNRYFNESS
jgi:tRNA nucleotidyltransferase/poly(A) polymerase